MANKNDDGRRWATITIYRECERNHSTQTVCHVVDGCLEFLGYGDDHRSEVAFYCSTCGCNRNFHRKEETTILVDPTTVRNIHELAAIPPPHHGSYSLKFSTTFHPRTDGQSERTIQTLEGMLRACVLAFQGSWDNHLSLIEFAYNNSYQATIEMAPYEALYGRRCRTPVCWSEVGERKTELSPQIAKTEIVQVTNEKIKVVQDKVRTAQSRQKSYADKRRRDLEFEKGDYVFLKVSPWKGVMRFGKKGKLSPRYIGPFEILQRVGATAYRLALPPNLSQLHDVFHVSMLRKYLPDPSHVLTIEPIELRKDFGDEILIRRGELQDPDLNLYVYRT